MRLHPQPFQSEFFMKRAEAVVDPRAFELHPQILEAKFEKFFVGQ
jgi:hypothetical protein